MSCSSLCSICFAYFFWSATPTAAWKWLISPSNVLLWYRAAFQTPPVRSAAFRYVSGTARWPQSTMPKLVPSHGASGGFDPKLLPLKYWVLV